MAHETTYEVIVGNATTVTNTLKSYEQTKSSHTLEVLGFTINGSGNYCVLVKYTS